MKDGRVAYVGRELPKDGAARVVEADGLVVSPGFIDPHTHLDAQVLWDPQITPSCWHGVTTALIGNCGVGLMPARETTRDMLLRDLVNVEGIEPEVLQAGVDWQWESPAEYLSHIQRNGLGTNIGALVSLTPLRHYVMGRDSLERAANAEERKQLASVLKGAMDAGAFGVSTDLLENHKGFGGGPLACRNADREELSAVFEVLRNSERGVVSVALNSLRQGVQYISEDDVDVLRYYTEASGRPVTFLPMVAKTGDLDFRDNQLERLGDVADKVVPQVSPMPIVFLQTLRKPFKFSEFPAWKDALNGSYEEQMKMYADPEFRKAAKAEQVGHIRAIPWQRVRVIGVEEPSLAAKYKDRYLGEIAESEGREPMDVFLDIGIDDKLRSLFQFESANLDRDVVRSLLQEPRFMLGISDAGAHIDQVCDLRYPTVLLGDWVRKEAALSLEFAIWKLTHQPASIYGIRDRGLLKPGYHADLCIFDPEKIGAETPVFVDDLPAGGRRLTSKAHGIVATFIGGTQVMDEGAETGNRPGSVVRSNE